VPALVFSFALLGGACALSALCYAELAAMIPQAGSAYAYSYATLGELVAGIIGWDLILEYAVGNVAVAISWGDYFTTLLRGIGIDLPAFLTTGYRTALLSANPEVHRLIDTAPARRPVAHQPPGVCDRLADHVAAAARGSRERHRQYGDGNHQARRAVALHDRRRDEPRPGKLHALCAERLHRYSPGPAIVPFAYIGFDAISTAAEETRNPQRNLPIGILGGLTVHTDLHRGRHGADRARTVPGTGGRGSARPRPRDRRFHPGRVGRRARRRGLDGNRAAGLPVRPAAHLLRDGARWPPPAVGRAGEREDARAVGDDAAHRSAGRRGVVSGDAAETYDLTNIGTLFAFALVCAGVLVLRVNEPARPRPFKVPVVWVTAPLGIAACVFVMFGLPNQAWERFGIWIAIGLVIYGFYGYRNSRLRAA
jgi:basic amino acid/polyamine antiporter, APA family